MKTLVTGGCGFIGSNLVDKLIDLGYDVLVVDNLITGKEENINKKAKFYKINLTNYKNLESIFSTLKPEIVFHLASNASVTESIKNPKFDAENNILGSINLFELSIKNKVKRIIYSSTGGAVYIEGKNLPKKENAKISPISPYGVSKYCVEKYLDYYKNLYKIERVTLRYSNVYGPRQDPFGEAGVVAIFTNRILKGERPIVYGDGNQTRDFIYVDDVIKANILSIDGEDDIYNIGTGIETSINELIKIFSKILDKNIEPIYDEKREGEIYRISLSTKKAERQLKFKFETSLEEGIKKTVDWFKIYYKL